MSLVGSSVKRVEDERLLRGLGEYIDDVPMPGALHVAVVRSIYAHARIRGIDASAALALPGVVAVETAETLGAENGPFPHPTWFPAAPALQERVRPMMRRESIVLLAAGKVRYVGEPVAAVIASDRYLADDAARLVQVDYEPLVPVVAAEDALADGAPLVNEEWPDNVAAHFVIEHGDVEEAFRRAHRRVSRRIVMPRSTCAPIENRGVVAAPDRRARGVTVWSSTQQPHWLRDGLERALGLPGDRIRVIAPDVGGGFGVKSMVYPEEILLPRLALRHDRALRWTDTRSENLVGATVARGQIHDIELAVAADGVILGLRDRYLVDAGAGNIEALVVPYNSAAHLQGPYRIPAARIECTTVLTNKTSNAAARGAGRPEAVFAMEGILDAAADELGMDRAAFRQANTLTASEMPYDHGVPYRDGVQLVIDGGDYRACLDDALKHLGYDALKADQARAWSEGRYIGVGLAGYIEGTGVGPYEMASIRVFPSGRAIVSIGPPSQGQGHETAFAQLAAEELGLPMEHVRVVQGDTGALGYGGGTIASRTAVVVGNAVALAARGLRAKIERAAADLLEASPGDIEMDQGRLFVRGSPDRAVSLGTVAARTAPGMGRLGPTGPGLEEHAGFQPPTVTFANGVHAVAVEVDVATGQVRLLRYVVVHDCGRLINPMIVEGQIRGGVVQGIGTAMFEELVYDDQGQLLSGSLMDYSMPRATDVPLIEVHHRETPSERNPLGIKGVGEAGAIPVAAAVVSAVTDALRPLGVTLTTCPVTPGRLLEAISAAGVDGAPPRPEAVDAGAA